MGLHVQKKKNITQSIIILIKTQKMVRSTKKSKVNVNCVQQMFISHDLRSFESDCISRFEESLLSREFGLRFFVNQMEKVDMATTACCSWCRGYFGW